MAAEFPDLVIRSHSDLADALARVKNFLQLSNETVEAVSGLAKGHCDKLLGPSRCKRIGPLAFDLLLGTLGIKLRVEVDLEQAQKMAARWERRQEMQVREHTRLSKQILEKARPLVLSELARKGWQTRKREARRNGHAAGR